MNREWKPAGKYSIYDPGCPMFDVCDERQKMQRYLWLLDVIEFGEALKEVFSVHF